MCCYCDVLNQGYDVGCMNDALGLIVKDFDLDLQQQEIIDGCLNIFAALGALFAAKIADGASGRRGCLATSATLYLAGVLTSALAPKWEVIALGRALCGTAVGLSFTSGGLYLSELAPKQHRGKFTSFYDLFVDFGIVLGSVLGFVAATTHDALFGSRWRFMIGFGATLPLLVLVCVPFLPESPRWLLATGKVTEARATLYRIYGEHFDVDGAIKEFDSMATVRGDAGVKTWSDFWLEMWSNVDGMRNYLYLVLVLGFFQQATGSESILYYCHIFLRQAGMESPQALAFGFILVGTSKLLGNIAPVFLSDTHGRLPFYHASGVGMALTLFALVLVCNAGTFGQAEVALMCLFLFFFSFGVGTLLWVVVPELLPYRWRARGLSAVVFLNRVTSATVTLTALTIIKAIKASGFFTVYLGFAVASLAFSLSFLPETAGRSLESLSKAPPPAGTWNGSSPCTSRRGVRNRHCAGESGSFSSVELGAESECSGEE